MTLRKCVSNFEDYSERGFRRSEPPLKSSTSLYKSESGTFQPELTASYYAPVALPALHRVTVNVENFSLSLEVYGTHSVRMN